jgi:hypothetical protein
MVDFLSGKRGVEFYPLTLFFIGLLYQTKEMAAIEDESKNKLELLLKISDVCSRKCLPY